MTNYFEESFAELQGVELADRYLLTLNRAKWICYRVIDHAHLYDRKFIQNAMEELQRIKFMILEYERYKRMKSAEPNEPLK